MKSSNISGFKKHAEKVYREGYRGIKHSWVRKSDTHIMLHINLLHFSIDSHKLNSLHILIHTMPLNIYSVYSAFSFIGIILAYTRN